MVTTSFLDWLRPVLLFAFYVAISCGGLFMMKAAPAWLSPKFAVGFFLYACGACLWLVILRAYPLSLAFPIAAGALMIGTTLIGIFFLREAVTMSQIAGATLIFLGIVLMLPKAQP